ncbi:glycosyltransferase [Enterobacter roggenkampii]|uniref:glycosyltransferase n=1 Tax=Enterobacter cloacae complex TaxID=354276 RepID=UPI000614BEB9|nr:MULTISPECIES: glycosyltransferase [Enterobacter cloacae complex]CAF9434583.1 UDP-Gal:alpha-D-GlcNAc-diphosphoundecaprenol beta-1%2C3-galactosyltransferase [Enterobacter cloacae]KKA55448.1 amylovoran biosynthesis protein AmsE [Enterobacter roggenkampii]MBN9705173.1 glycosyltransferase [Enterobacter roggenkampii]MCC3239012.1 glycosyltransferase [Enterobacter cloacae complex sp. 2021EL-01169]WGG55676.1 glycosyltransferase [Enterobacter roggenkampii]
MKISVLLSLYIKESPDFLHSCLASLCNQTYFPDEIVIVFDGPVTTELNECIIKWSEKLPVKIVKIENNVGLGEALNIGLRSCSNNIVFRMDTDDICHKDRFMKQVEYFEDNPDVGLLSSTVGEFRESIDDVYAYRKLPLTHSKILQFSKKRNPFNHMAVAFKKDLVLAAGGYQREYLYEDYALWVRMIQNGVITANLPETLVYARAGNGMAARRSGLKYAKSEFAAQVNFYRTGYLSFFELIRNLSIRIPLRLIPVSFLSLLYSTVLRK